MKIRAERSTLADTLTWVAQAIPKRPQMPALAGMRLTAKGDALTLQGFDYDISHTAMLDVDVASDGECLVAGLFLREIVSSLRGEWVELVLDGDQLTITCGRSTYRTQVLRIADYPSLPAQPKKVGMIDAGTLAEAVSTCKAPVDDASPFPAIRGMHIEGDATELVMVGLRSAVAITFTAPWACAMPFIATAPARLLDAAARGLSGEVAIGYEEGLLGFSDGSHSVTMRTFSDEFAKWRAILRPADQDAFSVVAEAGDLIEVTKRAGMLGDDETPIVVTFGPDEIEVQIAAGERGAGVDLVAAESTGNGRAALHSRYFVEALAAMPPGPVRLGVGTTEGRIQPIVIRPIADAATGRVSMVMPKKIPGGTK